MSDTTIAAPVSASTTAKAPRGWLRNPWRKPVFLATFTWAYIAWSILPVIIAIVFSFNAGRSRSTWQGFSLRWWWQDPNDSLFHDPAFRRRDPSELQALDPHGADRRAARARSSRSHFDRWHGRPASTSNFTMLFSFVLPEIVIGVSMFLGRDVPAEETSSSSARPRR